MLFVNILEHRLPEVLALKSPTVGRKSFDGTLSGRTTPTYLTPKSTGRVASISAGSETGFLIKPTIIVSSIGDLDDELQSEYASISNKG